MLCISIKNYFTCQCETEGRNCYGFQILHFYWSFSSDTMAVKGLIWIYTRVPGESYRRRFGSLLLYLCYVFRALINSLACWLCTSALGLVLFQICFEIPSVFTFFCLFILSLIQGQRFPTSFWQRHSDSFRNLESLSCHEDFLSWQSSRAIAGIWKHQKFRGLSPNVRTTRRQTPATRDMHNQSRSASALFYAASWNIILSH